MVQQLQALVQVQILGQGLFQPRGVQVLDQVHVQQLGLVGQVLVEGPDGGHLAGPRGVVQTAVPGQIVHVGVDVRQRDGANQIDAHVVNGDLVHGQIVRDQLFVPLQKTEKAAQIQVIFINRAPGVALDGLVIDQEIPEQRRGLGAVIHGGSPPLGDLPPLRSTKFLFC